MKRKKDLIKRPCWNAFVKIMDRFADARRGDHIASLADSSITFYFAPIIKSNDIERTDREGK